MHYSQLLWRFVQFRVVFGTDFYGTCGTGINKRLGRLLGNKCPYSNANISR